MIPHFYTFCKNMAEISDILKIGKDKYLEKNLEQECRNPFNEWIPYDFIRFRCYVENGIKKYEIYGKNINTLQDIYIRPWRYLISQEDGEFAIKYGIESYFIWRNYWASDYHEYQGFNPKVHDGSKYDYSNYDDRIKERDNDIKDFWKDFNKELNRRIEKLEEKDKNNKDRLFYTNVRLMVEYCWGLINAEWGDLIGGTRTSFYWQRKREEEEYKRKREEIDKKLEVERQEAEARKEKFRFNQRNKHPFDSTISFRVSDHLYIVNGVCLESVTAFVSNCFPKFNAELHAKQKAGALGISVQEVIEKWEQKGKESRDLGTAMHKKIENYYQGIDSTNDDTFNLFRIFANNIKLVPYRTEWAVYDWEYKLAGTIDFVDCQNGQYTIYDWKRSDKIIANGMPIKTNKYGEKGNYPLEHIDNSPYYHYALQLSLYKFILERNYGIKVDKLRLGIFHPTYNKPYLLEVPYLESEINSIFNLRSEVIF